MTRRTLRYDTERLPKSLKCEDLPQDAVEILETVSADDSRYLVRLFQIAAGDKKGQVVLLHDLTLADARASQARRYLLSP